MKIVERSFSGRYSRPRPILREEFNGELFLVATVWGNTAVGQQVIDDMTKYMSAAKGDVEVTSPFEFLPCYTSEGNALRVATLLANEQVCKGENKTSYASLIEVVAIWKNENKISWVQCGGPQILMKKPGRDLYPLSVTVDNSLEIFGANKEMSPMPTNGLGVDDVCNLNVGSCVFEEGDHVLLLSSVKTPRDLWQITDSDLDLAKIVKKISPQMEEQPFWLGLIG